MRGFLGAVNTYQLMWPKRAHLLKPLSVKSGKKTFRWTPEMDQAFKIMKTILAADVLMAYPTHNLPFHIYTDASDYQMGAVIIQQKRPVAYWSRKLTETQQNYHTMEKELLSIVMVLEEFRSMLLGAELFIYTDHKNLTFANLNCCHVLCWRLYVEEYGPTILYHPGKKNVIANTFSRLPRRDVSPIPVGENAPVVLLDFTSKGLDISDDPDLLECFLNLPLPELADTNPVDFAWIHTQQNTGTELATKTAKYPDRYFNKLIDGRVIVCHALPNENRLTQWKIALTKEMVLPLIKWYHCILAHPGRKRSRMTIQARYYHPDIWKQVDNFHCEYCQCVKIPCKGMGLLPDRDLTNTPW